MSVRVKVDEDLPRQVADLFVAQGHDAVTVVMQGWQGFPDEELWPRVQQENRWLITADKGFAN
jgi:predicted nuclease of predicted toxin-antitoxin system